MQWEEFWSICVVNNDLFCVFLFCAHSKTTPLFCCCCFEILVNFPFLNRFCSSYFHLQIDNDILLRRSSSLRQGLPNVGVSHGRRKSSLEEIGISHFTTLMQATNHMNPIKIALNGSIGLEVSMIMYTY